MDFVEDLAGYAQDAYDLLMTYWYLVLAGIGVFTIILLLVIFKVKLPFA